jgi:hypothetical protein
MNQQDEVERIIKGYRVAWSEVSTAEIIHELNLRRKGIPGEWLGSIEIFELELFLRTGKHLRFRE